MFISKDSLKIVVDKKQKGLGGTYSKIDLAYIQPKFKKNTVTAVVKQYGYEKSQNIGNARIPIGMCAMICTHMLMEKSKFATAGLNVPVTYGFSIVPDYLSYAEAIRFILNDSKKFKSCEFGRLVLLEEYTGKNICEFLIEDIENVSTLIYEVKEYISKVPKDLYIDTNPKNFTYHNKKIYYIDFFLPKLVEYQKNQCIKNTFPLIEKRGYFRESRRQWRSYNRDGRIFKFNFYLEKILNNENIYCNKS